MTLRVQTISVGIDHRLILDRLSLTIQSQEIVALTGRSGSGKSTLLKVIAGIVRPNSGSVVWDDEDLTTVPTHLRRIGMVFQDRLLFPHFDVAGNVAFGLRYAKQHRKATADRAQQMLELVGLPGFGTRSVGTLSGGEAQRVALARALAPQPRMLLLDEPMGALDVETRRTLTHDLRQILRAEHVTALHVTHDPEEARQIADRVVEIGTLKSPEGR